MLPQLARRGNPRGAAKFFPNRRSRWGEEQLPGHEEGFQGWGRSLPPRTIPTGERKDVLLSVPTESPGSPHGRKLTACGGLRGLWIAAGCCLLAVLWPRSTISSHGTADHAISCNPLGCWLFALLLSVLILHTFCAMWIYTKQIGTSKGCSHMGW